MYLTAMSGVLGMKVEFDTWSATASSASSEPQPAEPAEKKSKIATLLDHSNPSWIAEQSGFEVGGNAAEKMLTSRSQTSSLSRRSGRVLPWCRRAHTTASR